MAIDRDELSRRFDYHKPSTEDVVERHQYIRQMCHAVARELTDTCPESRELALALTKIEEAMFWANAAVARHQ